ncbi:MAG: helix-turn-helix domain-containing protein [Solirubrobacteraceae bacterium]
MSVSIRHVDLDATADPDSWPSEAIETILARGTLSDWRRLARAIRRNPWGPAARTAETITGRHQHYGADALIAGVIDRAREELTSNGRAAYAAEICAWRAKTGLTLRRFAEQAGTSASRLSAYENAKVAPTTDVLARLRHVAELHAAED